MRNAQILLVGGPFGGQRIASVPPDLPAPAQVVWSGWSPAGFTALLYEWTGEVRKEDGVTADLVYHCTGRVLTAAEIPPLIADDAEVWADGASLIVRIFDIPAAMLYPGV